MSARGGSGSQATRPMPDWGAEPVAIASTSRRLGATFAAFGAPLVVMVALAATGVISVPASLLAAVVWIVAVGVWIAIQGRLALRAARARPARSDELVRLRNVVEGLADEVGIAVPALYVIPGGPNAFVCAVSGRPVIAAAAAETLTRTELEAVAAHCLARFASGSAGVAQLAVALGPLAATVAPPVGGDDIAAVSITRYPPALAQALQRAEARADRFAPLWLVAAGSSPDPELRAAALLDL